MDPEKREKRFGLVKTHLGRESEAIAAVAKDVGWLLEELRRRDRIQKAYDDAINSMDDRPSVVELSHRIQAAISKA